VTPLRGRGAGAATSRRPPMVAEGGGCSPRSWNCISAAQLPPNPSIPVPINPPPPGGFPPNPPAPPPVGGGERRRKGGEEEEPQEPWRIVAITTRNRSYCSWTPSRSCCACQLEAGGACVWSSTPAPGAGYAKELKLPALQVPRPSWPGCLNREHTTASLVCTEPGCCEAVATVDVPNALKPLQPECVEDAVAVPRLSWTLWRLEGTVRARLPH
jgi:hypothetical protein